MSSKPHSLESLDDAALIGIIKSQSDDCDAAFEVICSRYAKLISTLASTYHNVIRKYDIADFIQEGRIALHSACKSFDSSHGVSFKNYAMACIKNRFRSINRHLNMRKKASSRVVIPIDESVEKSDDPTVMSLQEVIESKEYVDTTLAQLSSVLSKLENNVLRLYLDGYSYSQIAVSLGITEKAVDNSLYRIRRKINR